MNGKISFEAMNSSLNYSEEMVEGGFEKGQMKSII